MGRARRGPVDGRWGRGIRRPGKQRSDERPVPSELAGSFAEGLANGFGRNGFSKSFSSRTPIRNNTDDTLPDEDRAEPFAQKTQKYVGLQFAPRSSRTARRIRGLLTVARSISLKRNRGFGFIAATGFSASGGHIRRIVHEKQIFNLIAGRYCPHPGLPFWRLWVQHDAANNLADSLYLRGYEMIWMVFRSHIALPPNRRSTRVSRSPAHG